MEDAFSNFRLSLYTPKFISRPRYTTGCFATTYHALHISSVQPKWIYSISFHIYFQMTFYDILCQLMQGPTAKYYWLTPTKCIYYIGLIWWAFMTECPCAFAYSFILPHAHSEDTRFIIYIFDVYLFIFIGESTSLRHLYSRQCAAHA